MALTKYFKETIMVRATKDPHYRQVMLEEAMSAFLKGDLDSTKSLVRDYINAVVTFSKLASYTGIHIKSLQRMLGPNGNPTLSNFCEILQAIQVIQELDFNISIKEKLKESSG